MEKPLEDLVEKVITDEIQKQSPNLEKITVLTELLKVIRSYPIVYSYSTRPNPEEIYYTSTT